LLTLPITLVVHAIVAPGGVWCLVWHYLRRHPLSSPINVSIAFVAVVDALDGGLVAPIFKHSYAMFRSLLGTWIPFVLILAGDLRRRSLPKPHRIVSVNSDGTTTQNSVVNGRTLFF
jgi:hypothetical protein